jgi:hypothetical protein
MHFIYKVRLRKMKNDGAYYISVETLRKHDGSPCEEDEFLTYSYALQIPTDYTQREHYNYNPLTLAAIPHPNDPHEDIFIIEIESECDEKIIQQNITNYMIKRFEITSTHLSSSTPIPPEANNTSGRYSTSSTSATSSTSSSPFISSNTASSLSDSHTEGLNTTLNSSFYSHQKTLKQLDYFIMLPIPELQYNQLTNEQIESAFQKTIDQAQVVYGQLYSAGATIVFSMIMNGIIHTVTLGNSLAFCVKKFAAFYNKKANSSKSDNESDDRSQNDFSDDSSDSEDDSNYQVIRLNQQTHKYSAIGGLPYASGSQSPTQKSRLKNTRQHFTTHHSIPRKNKNEEVLLFLTTNNIGGEGIHSNDEDTNIRISRRVNRSRSNSGSSSSNSSSSPSRSPSRTKVIDGDPDFTRSFTLLLNDGTDRNPRKFIQLVRKNKLVDNASVLCAPLNPRQNAFYGLFHGRMNGIVAKELATNFIHLLNINLNNELQQDPVEEEDQHVSHRVLNSSSLPAPPRPKHIFLHPSSTPAKTAGTHKHYLKISGSVRNHDTEENTPTKNIKPLKNSVIAVIKNIMGTLFSDQLVNSTRWPEGDKKDELTACKLNDTDSEFVILKKWDKVKSIFHDLEYKNSCININLPCLNKSTPEVSVIRRAIIDFDTLSIMNEKTCHFEDIINIQIKLDFVKFIDTEISRLEKSVFLTNYEPKVMAYKALQFELLESIKNPRKFHSTLQEVYYHIRKLVVIYNPKNKSVGFTQDKQSSGGYRLSGNNNAATFDEIIRWNRFNKKSSGSVTSSANFITTFTHLNNLKTKCAPSPSKTNTFNSNSPASSLDRASL